MKTVALVTAALVWFSLLVISEGAIRRWHSDRLIAGGDELGRLEEVLRSREDYRDAFAPHMEIIRKELSGGKVPDVTFRIPRRDNATPLTHETLKGLSQMIDATSAFDVVLVPTPEDFKGALDSERKQNNASADKYTERLSRLAKIEIRAPATFGDSSARITFEYDPAPSEGDGKTPPHEWEDVSWHQCKAPMVLARRASLYSHLIAQTPKLIDLDGIFLPLCNRAESVEGAPALFERSVSDAKRKLRADADAAYQDASVVRLGGYELALPFVFFPVSHASLWVLFWIFACFGMADDVLRAIRSVWTLGLALLVLVLLSTGAASVLAWSLCGVDDGRWSGWSWFLSVALPATGFGAWWKLMKRHTYSKAVAEDPLFCMAYAEDSEAFAEELRRRLLERGIEVGNLRERGTSIRSPTKRAVETAKHMILVVSPGARSDDDWAFAIIRAAHAHRDDRRPRPSDFIVLADVCGSKPKGDDWVVKFGDGANLTPSVLRAKTVQFPGAQVRNRPLDELIQILRLPEGAKKSETPLSSRSSSGPLAEGPRR